MRQRVVATERPRAVPPATVDDECDRSSIRSVRSTASTVASTVATTASLASRLAVLNIDLFGDKPEHGGYEPSILEEGSERGGESTFDGDEAGPDGDAGVDGEEHEIASVLDSSVLGMEALPGHGLVMQTSVGADMDAGLPRAVHPFQICCRIFHHKVSHPVLLKRLTAQHCEELKGYGYTVIDGLTPRDLASQLRATALALQAKGRLEDGSRACTVAGVPSDVYQPERVTRSDQTMWLSVGRPPADSWPLSALLVALQEVYEDLAQFVRLRRSAGEYLVGVQPAGAPGMSRHRDAPPDAGSSQPPAAAPPVAAPAASCARNPVGSAGPGPRGAGAGVGFPSTPAPLQTGSSGGVSHVPHAVLYPPNTSPAAGQPATPSGPSGMQAQGGLQGVGMTYSRSGDAGQVGGRGGLYAYGEQMARGQHQAAGASRQRNSSWSSLPGGSSPPSSSPGAYLPGPAHALGVPTPGHSHSGQLPVVVGQGSAEGLAGSCGSSDAGGGGRGDATTARGVMRGLGTDGQAGAAAGQPAGLPTVSSGPRRVTCVVFCSQEWDKEHSAAGGLRVWPPRRGAGPGMRPHRRSLTGSDAGLSVISADEKSDTFSLRSHYLAGMGAASIASSLWGHAETVGVLEPETASIDGSLIDLPGTEERPGVEWGECEGEVVLDVAPLPGRAVLLLSGAVDHATLPAATDVVTVTAWF